MKYAAGDIYFNTLMTSICELVAYLSSFVVLKLFGLRLVLMMLSCTTIVFGIPLIFDIPIRISTVCLVIARFGIQATYPCMHYLGNSSLFHPLFVPFVYMIGNFAAKAITILAPQIIELYKPIPILSSLVASLGIFVCSILIKT